MWASVRRRAALAARTGPPGLGRRPDRLPLDDADRPADTVPVRLLLFTLLLLACRRGERAPKGAQAKPADAPAAETQAPASPIARCSGNLDRFAWKRQAGAATQGRREEAAISAESKDGALAVRYEWSGDVVDEAGKVTLGSLTWSGVATPAERAEWDARLQLPILERRRAAPGPALPASDASLLVERAGCFEFGTPDAAWLDAAKVLRARAGEDLPYDQRAAYGLPVDDVIVRPGDAPLGAGALQCGERRIDGQSSAGRLVFSGVPAGACSLSLDGVAEPYEGVRRGDRLVCAPAPRRAACSVATRGDRPPAG